MFSQLNHTFNTDLYILRIVNIFITSNSHYFTKSNNKRSASENVLALYAQTFGIEGKTFPDVNTAYKAAVDAADEKDFVFIGGSSYVVADFLKNCI